MKHATAYLLTMLGSAIVSVLAFPLLCLPGPRRRWARMHRREVGLRRFLVWLPAHIAVGLPAGLFTLVLLGNALLAVAVIPLWWTFPADDPARLLVEARVTTWGSAIGLGLLQLAILGALAYATLPRLASAHARMTTALLAPSPSERLSQRVAVLTRTRTDVLEAHGAELRRIERDLHDGTQARLVAIAMRLAVARQALGDDQQTVADLLRDAHENTEEAMTELREVIRTMYPPILADHGLTGALKMVAARGGVPIAVEVGDLGRLPAAVESVAYFAVTESLTNVAKHSHASSAAVSVRRTGDRLTVVTRDDGVGGADPARGTGLSGIRGRARALDGTLAVSSPAGGPTEVTVELPCGW